MQCQWLAVDAHGWQHSQASLAVAVGGIEGLNFLPPGRQVSTAVHLVPHAAQVTALQSRSVVSAVACAGPQERARLQVDLAAAALPPQSHSSSKLGRERRFKGACYGRLPRQCMSREPVPEGPVPSLYMLCRRTSSGCFPSALATVMMTDSAIAIPCTAKQPRARYSESSR
jgi:hypothetical protein